MRTFVIYSVLARSEVNLENSFVAIIQASHSISGFSKSCGLCKAPETVLFEN